MTIEKFRYDNKIVAMFAWATIIWGIVGMLGRPASPFSQLPFPVLNFDAHTTFGRIRPLHIMLSFLLLWVMECLWNYYSCNVYQS